MRKKLLVRIILFAVLIAAVLIYMFCFNGNGIYLTWGNDSTTLAKLEKRSTYSFEAEILISDAKKEYEELFGSSVWSQTVDGHSFEDYVLDQIKAKLLRVRSMVKMADERGVVLGREATNNIKNAVEEYMATLSEADKKSLNITEDKLTEMFTDFALADKMYNDIISTYDIEVSADEARVISIQYIVSDSREGIDAAKTKLDNGSSFFSVAKETNADGEYEYELKRGEVNSTFEDAAFNLSTGDVSDIVSADGKYYIIRCVSDNNKAKTEVNQTEILAKRQLEKFNEMFESYESELNIYWNDSAWKKLKISDAITLDKNFEEMLKACI